MAATQTIYYLYKLNDSSLKYGPLGVPFLKSSWYSFTISTVQSFRRPVSPEIVVTFTKVQVQISEQTFFNFKYNNIDTGPPSIFAHL